MELSYYILGPVAAKELKYQQERKEMVHSEIADNSVIFKKKIALSKMGFRNNSVSNFSQKIF